MDFHRNYSSRAPAPNSDWSRVVSRSPWRELPPLLLPRQHITTILTLTITTHWQFTSSRSDLPALTPRASAWLVARYHPSQASKLRLVSPRPLLTKAISFGKAHHDDNNNVGHKETSASASFTLQ